MGRSARGSGSGYTSARSSSPHVRSSSPHAHQSYQPPRAHAATRTAAPPPPHQHQPAPVAPRQAQPVQVAPQGPGLLGTVASVAAGSVIGHGISSMLFGGHTSAPAPQAPQQQAPPPATMAPIAPASLTPEADFNPEAYRDGPCGPYVESYTRCLEVNNQQAPSCQWAYDLFLKCKKEKFVM